MSQKTQNCTNLGCFSSCRIASQTYNKRRGTADCSRIRKKVNQKHFFKSSLYIYFFFSVDKAKALPSTLQENFQTQAKYKRSAGTSHVDLNSSDSGITVQDDVNEEETSFYGEYKTNKMTSLRHPLQNRALDSVDEEEKPQADDVESNSASTEYSTVEKKSSFTQSNEMISPPLGTQIKVIAKERLAPPDQKRKFLRDILMFLLISNACLWVFLSLEGTAFDVQSYQDDYYGAILWTIISMICRPLNIFFRMHSAACLFEVWSFA